MVSQQQISSEQQLAWFERQKTLLNQKHFSVFYKDKIIGSANVKVAPEQASQTVTSADVLETGLYIGDEKYRGNLLAFAPSLLLNDFCFQQLGTTVLLAQVHPENIGAIQYNLKLGYTIENEGRWIEMQLLPDSFNAATKMLKGLLNRPRQQAAKN
jgi:RimJ/RimL family protein N-acetyltransferase